MEFRTVEAARGPLPANCVFAGDNAFIRSWEVLRFAQDGAPVAAFRRTRRSLVHSLRHNSTTVVICFTIAAMPRLPFITFEGSEGCGKSTQVQLLAERLKQSGIPLLVTREPGGTPIGEAIKNLLQFAPHGSGMTPETELLLFEASRSQLVRETIRPALERGVCVISDRFFDSTTVYQGVARKLDTRMVGQLNAFAVGDCVLDMTFLLDLDAANARERMLRRVRPATPPDRMEQEPTEFYERVREAYRQLACQEAKRIHLIDGAQAADEIADKIWEILSECFPEFALKKKLEI